MQYLEGSATPVLYIGRTVLLRLINVLYVNKQEFSASSWRSTKVLISKVPNMRYSHSKPPTVNY